MKIRLVKTEDIPKLREMIIETYKRSFKNIYPESWIQSCIQNQSIERLTKKAELTHFYVALENRRVVGCAAIGSYWGKEEERCLFSFCVHPNLQGKGIGKSLLNTIKKDDFFINAKKVFCPSSIPALPFYLKNGFKHCEDKLNYEDGSFLLEFNNL